MAKRSKEFKTAENPRTHRKTAVIKGKLDRTTCLSLSLYELLNHMILYRLMESNFVQMCSFSLVCGIWCFSKKFHRWEAHLNSKDHKKLLQWRVVATEKQRVEILN